MGNGPQFREESMWATDKQVGFIYVLSKQLGRESICDPSRLTVEDASSLIKQLVAERQKPRHVVAVSRIANRLSRYVRA